MTQITVTDLNNAKLDVDTIADIANSTAETVTDRLGATRRTIYSLSNEYPNASANAAAAALSETNAATSESNALTYKTDAESARDAAIIGSGVYVDEPTGRAAVADGQAFKVQGSGNVAAYEYRRVDSGSSTLIATYPSINAITSIKTELYDIVIPNLFNPDAASTTQRLSPSTGAATAVDANALVASDYIAVTQGAWYSFGGSATPAAFNTVVGFFNSSNALVSKATLTAIAGGYKFQVPSGTGITTMRLNVVGDVGTREVVGVMQINEGQSLDAYTAYTIIAIVKDEHLPDYDLEYPKISDLYDIVIPNLFNPDAADLTKRLSPSSGDIAAADANPVIASAAITCTQAAWYSFGGTAMPTGGLHVVGFFDVNNVIVSKATLTAILGGYKFQVPSGTGITTMRFNIKADAGTHAIIGNMQINAGETLNDFTAYEVLQIVKDEHLPDLTQYMLKADLLDQVSFNLINPSAVDFVKRYSTGSKAMIIDGLGIAASAYIAVTENEWYTVSGNDGVYGLATGSGLCQGGYFANYGDTAAISNISFVTPVGGVGAAFKVPTGLGITHVVISLRPLGDAYGQTTLNGLVQLEMGEAPTAYQAFNPVDKIKTALLPQQSSSSTGTSFDAAAWYKFTAADDGDYLADKLPNFRQHWFKRDKDLCVVNTGTSLTARSTEHCSDHENKTTRPPLMHSNNFASLLWDRIAWDGQQYRRYDSGAFTESVGTFLTSSALAEWDDGAYRDGLTRYSETTGAKVEFVVPVNMWQFNFIYRTDSTGVVTNTVVVAEGNGKMEVLNESDAWVEANGFVFSMREATPVTRSVSIPYPQTDTFASSTIASKSNTTYQKRLKMRAVGVRTSAKNISITGSTAGRFMYWGVEYSPRKYMITYINAARGSHDTQATSSLGLPRYQDNEIWSFKPDLLFFELPIHNDGTDSATARTAGYWSRLTNNFVFRADYELSLKTRGAYFGLSPEIGMFTSSIAYNFGGIDTDGTLKYNAMSDGTMMSSLDKFNEAHLWVLENQPTAISINAAKRWVDAAIAIFGDLRTATTGSGKTGATFTNEGSHWNDTGSKIIAKAVLPVFGFTR